MCGRWLVTAYHFAFLAVLANFGGKRIGLASGTAQHAEPAVRLVHR
jgi:hypothetical protein